MKKLILFAFSFLLFASVGCKHKSHPGNANAIYVKDNYIKYEYQVPMRDGKKLFTSVYIPKDQTKKYLIIMDSTHYSVAPYENNKYKGRLVPSLLFMHDGYIFVYQDVLCRFMS